MSIVNRFFYAVLAAAYGVRESETGQGLAEYGLILALVAVLCVAALTTLQGGISNTLNTVVSSL